VVLAAGKPERAYAFFAEAIRAAGNGDTIEVRGDGPFFTDPVQTGRKRLTIRAAPGTRPVIELDLDAAKHDPAGNDYLLLAHAPLTLEGLEFRRLNEKPWQRGTFLPDIILSDSALHIANCRFILGRARDTILNLRGPWVTYAIATSTAATNATMWTGFVLPAAGWSCITIWSVPAEEASVSIIITIAISTMFPFR
jgi:hypothetical protein